MRILKTLSLLAFLLAANRAQAQESQPSHPFGLGLELGAPTGLTAKYYIGNRMALAFGLGVVEDYWYDDALHLHLDVLWHPVVLTRTDAFTLPLYVGVGGRYKHDYNDHCYWVSPRDYRCYDYDDDDHLGVRVPFGLLMDFNRIPLDIFAELALVVDIIEWNDNDPYDDDDRVSLYFAIGGRYYF